MAELNTQAKFLKEHRNFILLTFFFFCIYCLISLVNHYNFRTYALDLGAYTNALYDYAHLQWNDSLVFKDSSENLIADHFDLYLMFFSPLSYLLGTYTLLLVQIISVLFGGLGIYLYFLRVVKNKFLSNISVAFFYVFFGVFSALAFDYHSNVVAAMLLPWLFYTIAQQRLWYSSLLILLLLIGKENISLWLFFVCLGLIIKYRKNSSVRNYLVAASLFCICYFVFITVYVMPSFSISGSYQHFHYSYFGNDFVSAIAYLIKHPIDSFTILFTNHVHHPKGDYVKAEIHLLLLISGLPFLLARPYYFLMLIPIYFQKLFHDNYSMWGIGGQYSIEFAPVFAVGIFEFFASFTSDKLLRIFSFFTLLMGIVSSVRIMDNTVYFTDKSRIRLYQARHYHNLYDVAKAHNALKLIPAKAVVSAQSPFLPHLSLRDSIYQFPMVKNAEYLVFSIRENTYPLSISQFLRLTKSLENSREWQVVYNDEITVLKKKN